jgi:hypothetical protein
MSPPVPEASQIFSRIELYSLEISKHRGLTRMRTSTTIILAIEILGLAGLGMAADPIIGTWRLNLSQSKFSPVSSEMVDPRPKLHIETYREIEDRIEVSGTVTRLDGSSTSGKLSWSKQGGVVKLAKAAVSDLSIVEVYCTGRAGQRSGSKLIH